MVATLKVVKETPEAVVSFEDFWRIYPRRVARKDAMKAWARIKAAEYPKILGAVVRARCTDQWQRDDGRFIPYPASYLRGERWTDELEVEIEPVDRIDSQCQQFAGDTRCPGHVVFWNRAGTKGNCKKCGPSGL